MDWKLTPAYAPLKRRLRGTASAILDERLARQAEPHALIGVCPPTRR
jgi:hypothetical protein